MKFLVFFLFICGISLSLGQMLENDPQGRACVPNSTFMDKEGCNRCVCTNDGQRFACTKRFCHNISGNVQSDHPRVSPVPYRRKRDDSCEPNSSFLAQDGCNTCHCNAEGTRAFCTRMECPPKQEATPYRKKRDTECEPGSRFKAADGCNWCTCSDDGKNSFCTLMACVGKSQDAAVPYRRKRDDSCEPNSSFLAQDGCNTCHCNAEGTRAFCTRMECPPKQEATPYRKKRDTECEPGSRFKAADGCNWCTCSDNGKHSFCTLMACVGKSEDAPVPYRRKRDNSDNNCVPYSTFLSKDGCNTCMCGADGRAACTLMACVGKSENAPVSYHSKRDNSDDNCVPNTNFISQDGCNRCTCDADGRAACTIMLCPPRLEAELYRKRRDTGN